MSARRTRVAIAGSGLAGLTCASELAGQADVIVFERLPVAGGEHWDEPRVAGLVQSAVAVGAHFALATQAVRWDGQTVLGVGPHGGLYPADVLVLATGHRPCSLSELGIGGPRVAGVLPTTVAHHLLRHRVCLGWHLAVIGGSTQAMSIVNALLATGSRTVTVLAPDGFHEKASFRGEVRIREGARVVSLTGTERITGLKAVLADGQVEEIVCDGLVLAHGRVPCRDVDGALTTDPRVVFAHSSLETADENATEAAGRAAADAARVAALTESRPCGFELRIGGPE